ncbi:2-C-methyl-D-erythritol 2,4-cyclodiphosphate synthase [bacterium]|nr:2-C-methyl-D-erythritol 2,4-cyclodiphosphate synthase [bacterium]MBU1919084.1 2-C-methyl-D-erythritol 2,4-cyclodiphosphate synthase [bacterium]
MNFRVGIGYDVHRFKEGRPCIIGGMELKHAKGLDGHSDADVLLHAICDSLLGAANLGDIGELFPDTDVQFKGADSKELLKISYDRVKEKGFTLGNLDTIVVCERPKLGPHKKEIAAKIAEILNVDSDLISVKATTEEKMGFTGKEEGIKAYSYCLLYSA